MQACTQFDAEMKHFRKIFFVPSFPNFHPYIFLIKEIAKALASLNFFQIFSLEKIKNFSKMKSIETKVPREAATSRGVKLRNQTLKATTTLSFEAHSMGFEGKNLDLFPKKQGTDH